MSSSDDCTRTDRPMCPLAGRVPMGWERKVEEGSLCYIRQPLIPPHLPPRPPLTPHAPQPQQHHADLAGADLRLSPG